MPGCIIPERKERLGVVGEAAALEVQGGDHAQRIGIVAFIPFPAYVRVVRPEAGAEGFGDNGGEFLA